MRTIEAAIIGGTGVEQLQGTFTSEVVTTQYGDAQVHVGEGMIFLSRHGADHSLPPHRVNYRANLKALQMLGVTTVLASFAVGTLSEAIPPGSIVVPDQLIDLTSGRDHSFVDGLSSGTIHMDFTEPFCAALRASLIKMAAASRLRIHTSGTYVCTNGPRRETAAEVSMLSVIGADIVGMTAAPEAMLARELGMHYASAAVPINWAAGIRGLTRIDQQARESIRDLLLPLFQRTLQVPLDGNCTCQEHLRH